MKTRLINGKVRILLLVSASLLASLLLVSPACSQTSSSLAYSLNRISQNNYNFGSRSDCRKLVYFVMASVKLCMLNKIMACLPRLPKPRHSHEPTCSTQDITRITKRKKSILIPPITDHPCAVNGQQLKQCIRHVT